MYTSRNERWKRRNVDWSTKMIAPECVNTVMAPQSGHITVLLTGEQTRQGSQPHVKHCQAGNIYDLSVATL